MVKNHWVYVCILSIFSVSMGTVQAKSLRGFNQDNKRMARESLEWVVSRAAAADPNALVELAVRFERGIGVRMNLERSHQVYCQAARLGSVRAELSLARMYLEGSGTVRDQGQAVAWLSRAAEGGDRVAASVLQSMPPSRSPAICYSGPPVRGLDPLPQAPVVATADVSPKQVRAARAGMKATIQAWVYTLAPSYGLDPQFVLTIAAIESNFNPSAKSPKNAQGVMQLIPQTAERFGVSNIEDPLQNLKGGMSYLRWLMAYFKGDVRLVAAAYNAGEGAVEKHGGVPPYAETQAYVEKVTRRYTRPVHPYRPGVASPSSLVTAVAVARPTPAASGG